MVTVRCGARDGPPWRQSLITDRVPTGPCRLCTHRQ